MPFYTLEDMREGAQKGNPDVSVHAAVGEFMKVAVVTKPEGKGPALHEHPNEEQWTLILEGQMHFILGDEDRIVGPGTIVHIPRNVKHQEPPGERAGDHVHGEEPRGQRRNGPGLQ